MLDRITTDGDHHMGLSDDLAIRGIKEELESWASSPTSSSPTFSHQNDSDEGGSVMHEFLSDVVVNQKSNCSGGGRDNRDTPSPGSTSSSSGCFSDFSCSNDMNVALGTQFIPQPVQLPQVNILSSVPVTRIAPKPIQIQQNLLNTAKTVILTPRDFGQLMKTMKVTNVAPKIQTVVQSKPLAMVKPKTTEINKPPEPLIRLQKPLLDEKTLRKQQRLIRNRESANQSRKKKKEFVTALEEKIQVLDREKEQLLVENGQLRMQLLNNVCSRCSKSVQDVTLRKPISSGRIVTKKNSMLVLAMILTVSLNFGPLK